VNIVKKVSQCELICVFPVSFRLDISTQRTYHRATPWLIGFIFGYLVQKCQHHATPQELNERRIQKMTLRKVRAIAAPVTNCRCPRATCLTSQQEHNSELFCGIFQSIEVKSTIVT